MAARRVGVAVVLSSGTEDEFEFDKSVGGPVRRRETVRREAMVGEVWAIKKAANDARPFRGGLSGCTV